MMTALLLYAYSQGLYASRRIVKRVRSGGCHGGDGAAATRLSDHQRLSEAAFVGAGRAVTQVLQLCQKARLVRVGHVALDGTKIPADAPKHKTMSDSRMQTTEPALAAKVAQWLTHAAASDAREDAA